MDFPLGLKNCSSAVLWPWYYLINEIHGRKPNYFLLKILCFLTLKLDLNYFNAFYYISYFSFFYIMFNYTLPLKNLNFYFGRGEQTTFITIHWVQNTDYSNKISLLHNVLNYTKEVQYSTVQYTYVHFVLVRVLKVLKIEFII